MPLQHWWAILHPFPEISSLRVCFENLLIQSNCPSDFASDFATCNRLPKAERGIESSSRVHLRIHHRLQMENAFSSHILPGNRGALARHYLHSMVFPPMVSGWYVGDLSRSYLVRFVVILTYRSCNTCTPVIILVQACHARSQIRQSHEEGCGFIQQILPWGMLPKQHSTALRIEPWKIRAE